MTRILLYYFNLRLHIFIIDNFYIRNLLDTQCVSDVITCSLERTLSSNRLHNPCKPLLPLQPLQPTKKVHIAVVKVVSECSYTRDLPSVNALSCIVSLALTEDVYSRDLRETLVELIVVVLVILLRDKISYPVCKR